jgi:uncharacterized OsmC-like protein
MHMSNLNEYLVQKRATLLERRGRVEAGTLGKSPLAATVSAEGRSGVRRIRIRDFQVISDSPPDFAGYNLGPSSPELQLGVLGSCLTHSFLIQAAAQQVPIDSLEVELHAFIDARAGHPAHADIPVYPQDVDYTVRIVSPAGEEQITKLHAAVERFCPILNLLRNPQSVTGRVEHSAPESATTA